MKGYDSNRSEIAPHRKMVRGCFFALFGILWCWTELGKKLRLAELYRTGYNIIKVSNGEMPSDR